MPKYRSMVTFRLQFFGVQSCLSWSSCLYVSVCIALVNTLLNQHPLRINTIKDDAARYSQTQIACPLTHQHYIPTYFKVKANVDTVRPSISQCWMYILLVQWSTTKPSLQVLNKVILTESYTVFDAAAVAPTVLLPPAT